VSVPKISSGLETVAVRGILSAKKHRDEKSAISGQNRDKNQMNMVRIEPKRIDANIRNALLPLILP
jgi:hypothetical protein